ncbi:MAG: hypothetical protein ACREA3_00430, partial [Nitrosotalea sp.]
MKTLHLSIIAIVSVIALVPQFGVLGQEVNMSPPEKPEFTATMDKMYYNGTDTAHVTISGPPSTSVNLVILDSTSLQQKLATVVHLDPNGTGTFSFNLTSYNYGIYNAMIGYGYDRVKIGFGVGILPAESGGILVFYLPKSDYKPSEIIPIQGYIQPNSIVQMDMIDPFGITENSTQITSNSSGSFWMELGVPHNAVNGTWSLSATSGVNHSTRFIVVHSNTVISGNSGFIPDISSDFFLNGHVIPNATSPVGFDLVNVGNFTLYDVNIGFVNSPLLQHFKNYYGNFTLKVGQEKTIMGAMTLPSQISNVSSTLNWTVYAKIQNGTTGSKEFHREINLANISTPEYSTDYSAILPPLQQGGGPLNYIECKKDLQLIIKLEDYTPACVTPNTNQTLVERGWGESLEGLLEPPVIKKLDIIGLQQNYKAGQPINATVVYTGWQYDITPQVKILDANGTQVWFNCPDCVMHSELAIEAPGWFMTSTYHVQDYNGHYPIINKTGTYAMVTSLDN